MPKVTSVYHRPGKGRGQAASPFPQIPSPGALSPPLTTAITERRSPLWLSAPAGAGQAASRARALWPQSSGRDMRVAPRPGLWVRVGPRTKGEKAGGPATPDSRVREAAPHPPAKLSRESGQVCCPGSRGTVYVPRSGLCPRLHGGQGRCWADPHGRRQSQCWLGVTLGD